MTATARKTSRSDWSPEAREAARLRVISRKPWKKSTGPRTERGKKISSMNAYKHGYYSQEMRDIRALLRIMDARLELLIQMRKAEERNRKLAKKFFSRNELSSRQQNSDGLGSWHRKKQRQSSKTGWPLANIPLFQGYSRLY